MNITEPMFLALTALVDEPRHQRADRLSAAGLVAPDREEVQQGRLRRYYRLTDEGTRALEEEAARMAATAGAATARLRARAARGTAAAPVAGGAMIARLLAGGAT